MNNQIQKTPVTKAKGQAERRLSGRINVGDVVNGTSVDPVFHSYLPFKAKVVNISKDGIQLALVKGSTQIAEGTKVIIIPTGMKEVTSSSKNCVVIWTKDQGKYLVCGCMFMGSGRL
ncbi:MAG: hypothetical protein OEY50_05840 [Nitrospinota bacterium]|nr:hypothetical protein [Nitrospinota bacterium]MDH5677697.1 hypothetical protein [Nitrospinota bacterium]MDH5755461.1 hypothetical protein [Nitrospinota bacterium]